MPAEPAGQQEEQGQWIPTKLPDIFGPPQPEPEAQPAPGEPAKPKDNTAALLMAAIVALVALGAIAFVAIYMKRKKKL